VFLRVRQSDGEEPKGDEKSSLLINSIEPMSTSIHPTEVHVTPNDWLIVVDMQNDFVTGSFAVKGALEKGGAVHNAVTLITTFARARANIVATRDYHPDNHTSFKAFPAHCIQGTHGSHLYPEVKDALQRAQQLGAPVHVAFKGFHADVESFGAFEYSTGVQGTRMPYSQCSDWTGSFVLKASGNDLDSPPDVMAVMHKQPLHQLIGRSANGARIFVCGLALDYCVQDTAVNAAATFQRQHAVLLVADAALEAVAGNRQDAMESMTRAGVEVVANASQVKCMRDVAAHLLTVLLSFKPEIAGGGGSGKNKCRACKHTMRGGGHPSSTTVEAAAEASRIEREITEYLDNTGEAGVAALASLLSGDARDAVLGSSSAVAVSLAGGGLGGFSASTALVYVVAAGVSFATLQIMRDYIPILSGSTPCDPRSFTDFAANFVSLQTSPLASALPEILRTALNQFSCVKRQENFDAVLRLILMAISILGTSTAIALHAWISRGRRGPMPITGKQLADIALAVTPRLAKTCKK
jgi:nicotinamidase-related amidase